MQQRTEERLHRIESVLRKRQKNLTVVLENIHDPHNVSAIYRSCDAFGVAAVHLYYTDNIFPKIAHKTSASAKKWVDTKRHDSPDSLLAKLKGYQILATSFTSNAKKMCEYDYTKATAFIMGNEHRGVADELVTLVTGEVYIPMYGMIQSFNVSVATAILLSEASRQRHNAGMYEQCSFNADEYEKILREWERK
ncbi:MAG: TrmH family RNA methyltransferase [Desulfovibrionaceae bacterium]